MASIQADAPLAGIQVNGKTATILIAGGIVGSTFVPQSVTPPVEAPQQSQLTATTTLTFKKGRVLAQVPSKSRAGKTEGRLDNAASACLWKLCKRFSPRSDEAGSEYPYRPLEQWVVQLLQTCLRSAEATRTYSIHLLRIKLERSVFYPACATAQITSRLTKSPQLQSTGKPDCLLVSFCLSHKIETSHIPFSVSEECLIAEPALCRQVCDNDYYIKGPGESKTAPGSR